jgi:hypothetical protein
MTIADLRIFNFILNQETIFEIINSSMTVLEISMKEVDYDKLFGIKNLTENGYWLVNRRNWCANNNACWHENENFLDAIICVPIAD